MVVIWPRLRVRRKRLLSAEDAPVEINTEKKAVLADYDSDEALQEQTYDGDEECDSGAESSDGEQDIVTTLPRNRRLRLLRYQRERVKNDIAHIFFRFQRFLSMHHGAYVFFILSK